MLLRLLIEEGQLAAGFAPAGRYEFDLLDLSFGKLVHTQFQPRRAGEPVRPSRMSAGAAGEPHGKVLAYCAERPPGKGRNVHAIVHMPYASNPGIGKKRRQAGLRAARPRAGITLCSQADRSGPGMELCMPPIRQPSRYQLLLHPDPPARHACFGRR